MAPGRNLRGRTKRAQGVTLVLLLTLLVHCALLFTVADAAAKGPGARSSKTNSTGKQNARGRGRVSKGATAHSSLADGQGIERLITFLDSVSALGVGLRAAGDDWLRAQADAVDAAAARLRGLVAPTGQRLREEIRERCSSTSFVPPMDMPAVVTGPGLSYTVRGGTCQLRREAAPLRRDLILSCTDPGVTIIRTVPRYTSAFTSAATFIGAECKTEFKYGLEATVTVDLWKPGERPQDVVQRWQDRAERWRGAVTVAAAGGPGRRRLAADGAETKEAAGWEAAAGGTGGPEGEGAAGGSSWDDGGEGARGHRADRAGSGRNNAGGESGDHNELGLLLRMHAAPADALRGALSRHAEAIRRAFLAWTAEDDFDPRPKNAPPKADHASASPSASTSSATAKAAGRVSEALGSVLRDLGLRSAAELLAHQLRQQRSSSRPPANTPQRDRAEEGERHHDGGKYPRQEGSTSATIGQSRAQEGLHNPEEPPQVAADEAARQKLRTGWSGPSSKPGEEDAPWQSAVNVTHLFDLVLEAGTRGMWTEAEAAGKMAAEGLAGGLGVSGAQHHSTFKAGALNAEASHLGGGGGVAEEGGRGLPEADLSEGHDVLRNIAAEVERLLQL